MSIKINEKLLSIPPYISTSWSRIASLHITGNGLAVTLLNGETVYIPNLNSEILNSIFQYHALYLEKDHPQSESADISKIKATDPGEAGIRLAFGSSLDNLGSVMQHNPNQANAPDLPPEILQKITAISKIIAPAEEQVAVPKAEPNCNCFHCQIAKALKPLPSEQEHLEPEVTVEDLQFQQWTITQTGDKLFTVVNRLDEHEKYHVYLGEPIGCTCGKTGCEHILAVLRT